MSVDFFAIPCANLKGNCQTYPIKCLQNITSKIFGISDADANNRLPAKIITSNDIEWDFSIENPHNKNVRFKAIDFCVDIFRTGTYNVEDENRKTKDFSSDCFHPNNNELIKRCEGFLLLESSIHFIEIKNRPDGNWLSDARKKFEETILSFREHHPEFAFIKTKAIVSNNLFFRTHQSEKIEKKILKDKIGVEFIISNKILI